MMLCSTGLNSLLVLMQITGRLLSSLNIWRIVASKSSFYCWSSDHHAGQNVCGKFDAFADQARCRNLRKAGRQWVSVWLQSATSILILSANISQLCVVWTCPVFNCNKIEIFPWCWFGWLWGGDYTQRAAPASQCLIRQDRLPPSLQTVTGDPVSHHILWCTVQLSRFWCILSTNKQTKYQTTNTGCFFSLVPPLKVQSTKKLI